RPQYLPQDTLSTCHRTPSVLASGHPQYLPQDTLSTCLRTPSVLASGHPQYVPQDALSTCQGTTTASRYILQYRQCSVAWCAQVV
ncbi:hypothetical protein BaRGS_00031724, partial [Batillaria attramentaria]